MRKLFIVLFILSFALIFTACGKDNTVPSENTDAKTDIEELDLNAGLRYFLKDDSSYAVAVEPNENTFNIVIPESRKGLVVNEIVYSSLFDKEYRSVPVSVSIPSTVTKIGEYSFSGYSSLKSVNIPDSVSEIGKRAFYGCNSISELTLTKAGLMIADEAFGACVGIDNLTLGANLSYHS